MFVIIVGRSEEARNRATAAAIVDEPYLAAVVEIRKFRERMEIEKLKPFVGFFFNSSCGETPIIAGNFNGGLNILSPTLLQLKILSVYLDELHRIITRMASVQCSGFCQKSKSKSH